MYRSETLRSLLDLTQDKIVVIDSEGTYRYANAATERILGYDPESFVGTNSLEYIHPDDCDRVREAFEQFVGADEELTETIQYRHRTNENGYVWLESRIRNRFDSELGGYVVSSRNITARREAEKRTRELEDRLQQLAANTDDVLWMFSADWDELLFVNDAFEDIWGILRSELSANPTRFLDEIHPVDRGYVRSGMGRLSAGEPVELEYRVNSDRSFRRWVHVQGQPIVEDGTVVRVAGFARDITDRRRRDRQLQVLDNLLRHNLRNTMNVILGHAELATECGDPTVGSGMEVILEAGSALLKTVEKEREIVEVLIDSNEPAAFDFASILPELLDTVRSDNPDVTIETEFASDSTVVAIPEIRNAIAELLENAVEHATESPKIVVQTESVDDSVVIRIRDNADPIPGNEFQPLFTSEDPSDLYHGTGLGLWLVYWVVDLSDGDLKFGHTPDDDGNVITIRLPRAE